MSLLDRKAFTITRTPYTFTKGRPVAGSPVVVKGIADFQPADGDDLLKLPEGERGKRVLEAFSDDTEFLKQDRLVIDESGEEFEAQHTEDWHDSSIGYYSALIVSVD